MNTCPVLNDTIRHEHHHSQIESEYDETERMVQYLLNDWRWMANDALEVVSSEHVIGPALIAICAAERNSEAVGTLAAIIEDRARALIIEDRETVRGWMEEA